MHATLPDEDVYSLLGVPAKASATEITRAYRKLAMTWHPDRNGSRDAEERFKRIRLAYETLRDPRRRAEYDLARRQAPRRTPAHAAPARAAASPKPSAEPRGRDLSRRIAITLAEQVAGCRPSLKVTRTEYCSHCHGAGRLSARLEPCGRCRGSGRVRKASLAFFIFRADEVACEDCAGLGQVPPPCPACGGSGQGATRRGQLRIQVPAGVRPEAVKRVRGFGRAARDGQSAGDLLVRISLARHPLFEVRFPDLACDMPVSALRLQAGGELEVPTVDGVARAALPEGAGEGTVLRLAGQGLLDGATGRRGTLHVTLRVQPTPELDEAQQTLMAEVERRFAERRGRGDPFAEWGRRLAEARRQRERVTQREP